MKYLRISSFLLVISCTAQENETVDETVTETVEETAVQPATALFEFNSTGPKNLLMLSMDTWRKDNFDEYSLDANSDKTPFLNTLLDHAVVLDNHQSCSSWTYPSITCALSGKDPFTIGYMPAPGPDGSFMPEDEQFLAERLQKQGFRTHLVSANTFPCSFNIGEEYDTVDCLTSPSVPSEIGREVREAGLIALDGLRKTDDPWFLHLHFMDTHLPYYPPAEYMGALKDLPPLDFVEFDFQNSSNVQMALDGLTKEQQAIFLSHVTAYYEAEVRYLDDQLSMLFAQLEKEGVLDDTLVVFWSDHGEQLGERGNVSHGLTLYGEENDALALFYNPDLAPARWNDRTGHEDLVPTILDIFGFDQDPEFTGSVAGHRDPSGVMFSYLLRSSTFQLTASKGEFKMHYSWNNGSKSLYNTVDDPQELSNIYNTDSPNVQDLWEALAPELVRIAPMVTVDGPTDANP